MRKVFISTIPLTTPIEASYSSEVYSKGSITGYPITVVMENRLNKGEEATVISIVAHSEGEVNQSEKNYVLFKEQLEELEKSKTIKINHVEITIGDCPTGASHRKLASDLQEQLHDGDEIFADITYGFKSNPIVIFTALSQAYQLKDEIDIKEIIYGNLYNGKKTHNPEMLDITSLFYMNALAGTVGSLNTDDSKKLFLKI